MNTASLIRSALTAAALSTVALVGSISTAEAIEVTVTIDNLAPSEGLILTPFWVGFHEGNFDLYDLGATASEGIELIAEDGDTAPLSTEFTSGAADRVDGTIKGSASALINPGESTRFTFDITEANPYFSYASMILPSNDGFIGNEDGTSYRLFDEAGNFIGADFMITGDQVLDAGTEVNDESPQSVPLLGDAHNVGPAQNGVVAMHPGFNPVGNVLAAYPQADFTQTSPYQVARIRVELAQ